MELFENFEIYCMYILLEMIQFFSRDLRHQFSEIEFFRPGS